MRISKSQQINTKEVNMVRPRELDRLVCDQVLWTHASHVPSPLVSSHRQALRVLIPVVDFQTQKNPSQGVYS